MVPDPVTRPGERLRVDSLLDFAGAGLGSLRAAPRAHLGREKVVPRPRSAPSRGGTRDANPSVGRRPLGGARTRAAAGCRARWLAPLPGWATMGCGGLGLGGGCAAARPPLGLCPGRTARKSQPCPGLGNVSQGNVFGVDAFQ